LCAQCARDEWLLAVLVHTVYWWRRGYGCE
jgi:hypothetical protein